MAVHTTQSVVEVIVRLITRSPSTPTGAGVTQVVMEAIVAGAPVARATQVVIEAIIGANPDGSHGDAGGGGTPSPTTRTFGYAV